MKERDLVKSIRKYLLSLGYTCYKYHGGAFGVVGHSDLYGSMPPQGRSYWFEVKLTGKHATPVQLAFIEDCLRVGAIAGTVHSVDEVKTLLNK